jgi:hypothetical protein
VNIRLGAAVGLVAVALILLTAAGARAAGLEQLLRGWFRLSFEHPRSNGEFFAIALNNSRVAILPFASAYLLRFVWRARVVLDVGLALTAAGNCVLVGLALAAYGSRLISEIALHGALELGGLSLAFATYIHARAQPAQLRSLGARSLASFALLALGAAVETWID